MPTIDKLTDLMRLQKCDLLTIAAGSDFVLERPDGSHVPVAGRLEAGKIVEFVREVAPPELLAPLASGAPLDFSYRSGETPVEVRFVGPLTNPRVRLSLRAPGLAPKWPTSEPLVWSEPHRGPAPPAPTSPPAATQARAPEPQNSLPGAPHRRTKDRDAPADKPAAPAVSETRARTTASAPVASDPAQLRLSLPALPPAILRVPEGTLRILAGVLGVVVGLVASAYLAFGSNPGSLGAQMFEAKGTITAVPVLIQCFFFWAVVICVVRWLRLRRIEALSNPALMAEVNRALSASTPTAVAVQLETPIATASPLLRRVRAVLRQWALRPGVPNANLVLQEHVAQDEESVRVGYGWVRAFVWVLPVLGLIGTAIGVAIAVGGFATFLGGEVEDVRIVKQHIVEVTSGLSFAFLMTLEGLLTALLAMLACSALQTREERLLSRVQRKITETFLPALQRFAPAEAAEQASSLNPLFFEQMMDRMVHGVVSAVSVVIDERERERRKEIADLGQAMQNVSQQITAQAHAVTEAAQAVAGLAGATQTAVAILSPLQAAIEQTGTSLGLLGTGLGALQSGQQTLTQSTEQLGAALAQWKADGAVNSLASTLQSVRDSLTSLAPVLAGFRGPFVFQAVPIDDHSKDKP